MLYLHNNGIRQIENLSKIYELTHLYLQWNKIERIENLSSLKCLKTLFLGNNQIGRLENLEKLTNLEELHIERQRLNEGTEFSFDLGCLDSLSVRWIWVGVECDLNQKWFLFQRKLRVLNITGLGLINLDFLSTLQYLQKLSAADNKFECPSEIGESIHNLPFLLKVEFRGCPAQRDIHYKEKIMAKAPKISILNRHRDHLNFYLLPTQLQWSWMEKNCLGIHEHSSNDWKMWKNVNEKSIQIVLKGHHPKPVPMNRLFFRSHLIQVFIRQLNQFHINPGILVSTMTCVQRLHSTYLMRNFFCFSTSEKSFKKICEAK